MSSARSRTAEPGLAITGPSAVAYGPGFPFRAAPPWIQGIGRMWRITMKWWIVAAAGVAVIGLVLARKADIQRFREMKRL